MRNFMILALVLVGNAGTVGAQTAPLTWRAQWEMAGPAGPEGGPRPPFTVAIAQGYTYKIYKPSDPSSGTPLSGVLCTTTNDPFTKTCTAPLPTAFNVAGVTLDMTAIVVGIESPHSNTAVVPNPLQPGAAPTNFRLIQDVARLLLAPFKAFGNWSH